ncbi:CBS domain-containing protein [Pseudaestuariivita atlantica]|uniref:Histidine kinase n=1 Tax=Pseudaestuariivita atlantica TaxID=1317121 RepID=A0A0L1JV24_9RHOB|nr:CBS domain-containing protein [Pseudaestuariivita atlantica]KNG95600.1 histidine kinase [Pseudaestuariivita atlantica]
MKIRDVLKAKAQRALVTLPQGETLRAAAERLSQERIGTVVISNDGTQADGILSERDIVRRLASEGAGALERKVEEVMTRNVITCDPDETLDAALATMTDGRFRHMPVVEGGGMIGILSLGDAVKARLDEVAYERDAMEEMIKGH